MECIFLNLAGEKMRYGKYQFISTFIGLFPLYKDSVLQYKYQAEIYHMLHIIYYMINWTIFGLLGRIM